MTAQLMTLSPLDFAKEVENHPAHAFVWFTAPWDQHHNKLVDIIGKFASAHQEISFFIFEAEQGPEILNKYTVRKMPSFIYFVKGKPVHRLNGLHTPDQFEQFVQFVQKEYPLK